jgi:hypothetical protein
MAGLVLFDRRFKYRWPLLCTVFLSGATSPYAPPHVMGMITIAESRGLRDRARDKAQWQLDTEAAWCKRPRVQADCHDDDTDANSSGRMLRSRRSTDDDWTCNGAAGNARTIERSFDW